MEFYWNLWNSNLQRLLVASSGIKVHKYIVLLHKYVLPSRHIALALLARRAYQTPEKDVPCESTSIHHRSSEHACAAFRALVSHLCFVWRSRLTRFSELSHVFSFLKRLFFTIVQIFFIEVGSEVK